MGTRRVTSYAVPGGPSRRALYCFVPACCASAQARPRVRYKVTTTSGSAKNCGLNIQSYDPTADPGRYMEIKANWTRKWLEYPYPPGTEVKSCEMETTITKLGSRTVATAAACGGSETDDADPCDPPASCDSPPGCTYEDSPTVYTGNDAVTEGEVADKARAVATSSETGWSSWAFGFANIIGNSAYSAVDNRSLAQCSYTEFRILVQVSGFARVHTLTWLDTITNLSNSTSSTEERSLDITGPGEYEVLVVADPGTRRTMGTIQVTLPATD